MLSVVIPTIEGREIHLDRCLNACHLSLDKFEHEIIVVRNKKTCGIAWQSGVERADGDYLVFLADDLEPHPNAFSQVFNIVREGHLPAPRILRPNGTIESCGDWEVEMSDGDVPEFTRIPFMSRRQWEDIGPMIPTQYFSDNWVSYRGRKFGYETVVCRSFQFTHHWALEGRDSGIDRMLSDEAEYKKYLKLSEEGNWP